MAAMIEVENLIRDYGGPRPAVAGIDLTVGDGELFGLLGPNGAGKTTTVSVCTTRSAPTSGRVRIAGHDAVAHPIAVKQRIGVVTQRNTLDRSCTVQQNLYYHCRFFALKRREARARTAELLDLFQLTARAKDSVNDLSGGMAQRLQIARAIAHRPKVLFLDEPTSGLDPQSRLALWDVVRDLRRDGTTVFLTTHYMEEADQLCDRVAIMDQGKVLTEGTPAELKRRSAAGRIVTITLTAPPNGLVARLHAIPGVTEVQPAESAVHAVHVHTDAREATMPRIVAEVGPELVDLSVSEPSLETVFITLTGRELRD